MSDAKTGPREWTLRFDEVAQDGRIMPGAGPYDKDHSKQEDIHVVEKSYAEELEKRIAQLEKVNDELAVTLGLYLNRGRLAWTKK